MFKLLKISACLAALALAAAQDICSNEWELFGKCGGECAPSGTCTFDKCVYCCMLKECPDYFKQECAVDPDHIYDGNGHCKAEGTPISACSNSCAASSNMLRVF
jgi:hypothetical protein